MLRDTTVRGRRLSYAESGSGRPLVLLHAFPLSHAMWRPQLDAPPPGWRLVAPDLRGFGASDRVPPESAKPAAGAQSMLDYAQDVAALIEELGLEQPVVGGLSMGGYVAFALWRLMGPRFGGLVLADTRPEADTDEARGNRRKTQELLLDRGVAVVADQLLPKLLGATTLRERPSLADEVRELIMGNTAGAVHDALEALATRPDSTSLLAEIRCPTLIVAGREDALTPVALHEAMHAGIAGSRLEVIDDAGHLSNLECPAEFSRVLRDFLSQVAE